MLKSVTINMERLKHLSDIQISRRQALQIITASIALPLLTEQKANTQSVVESGPNPKELERAEIIFHGKDGVAFTFDDNYFPEYVVDVANTALEKGVPVTFFPIGRNVAANPDLYKWLAEKGFLFANHTWDHNSLGPRKYEGIPRMDGHGNYTQEYYDLEYERIKKEILKQSQVLEQATGHKPLPYLRPPGGIGAYSGHENPILLKVCHDLGYKVLLWSDDSNGWREYPRTDEEAIKYTVSNIRRDLIQGTVVLQHSEPPDTLAFPKAIEIAHRRGLKTKSIAELLS